jgi:hypothetical protein
MSVKAPLSDIMARRGNRRLVPISDILPFMLVYCSGKTKSARLRTIGVMRCARQERHEDPLM